MNESFDFNAAMTCIFIIIDQMAVKIISSWIQNLNQI